MDPHGVHRSQIYHFCLDQTLNFLDFVAWSASNYSQYEHVIMDSNRFKIFFPINALVFIDSLQVPHSFTQKLEYFTKENLIEHFRHATVEEKNLSLLQKT